MNGKAKGGFARAAVLSPERRKEIATLGANVRWGTTTASALRASLGKKPRAKPKHLEDAFQVAVIAQARLMLRREVMFWHTPNGGKRNVREAAKLRKMGVLAGIPDLAFVRAGSLYFLELKVGKNDTTPIQDATIAALTDAGAQISVCRDMAQVVAAWRKWGLCR